MPKVNPEVIMIPLLLDIYNGSLKIFDMYYLKDTYEYNRYHLK
ncbi:hypothetical protein FM106_18245 [Brachybacterium faecium]|nr:hypothetical protein FM106_18245 [Brachybacterium faecium]